MRRIAKEGKKSAKVALYLKETYDQLLTTILIGNNLVNIAGTTIATILFVSNLNWPEALSTIVVTIVVLIFGEIFPKSIAKAKPETCAMIFAYPVLIIFYIIFPISWIFKVMQKGVTKLIKGDDDDAMTDEEFEMLVDEIHEQGTLNGIEKNIIINTLEYGDLLVSDIMTKAKKVIFIKASDSLEKIQETFERYNYSRLPISVNDSINGIYGIVYQKEFYEMLLNDEADLNSIVVEPLIVKPGIKISRQLKTFQRENVHMAIVKNKNKVLGIVTMEDILEELVGEIEDEYDEERDIAEDEDELKKELEEEKEKKHEQEVNNIKNARENTKK
jgi:CBS domain containing-hemolysin-like protein